MAENARTTNEMKIICARESRVRRVRPRFFKKTDSLSRVIRNILAYLITDLGEIEGGGEDGSAML